MCLGVPGKIIAVEEGILRMGTVDFDGSTLSVCLAYVPDAGPGDHVLVHAGFALARLDEKQVSATLEALREIDEASDSAVLGP